MKGSRLLFCSIPMEVWMQRLGLAALSVSGKVTYLHA